MKAVPHFDEAGGVLGMYVVGHDINEVKQAQEQLAAREEELRFFAENIPEAIAYIDLERGCTFVNNVFLASRGFTREFALGKFPEEVYAPEVMEELRPHLARVARGEETSYERFFRLPSGEERWVRVRLTPRRDAAGKVLGYYAVSTDIHEIKTAQAAIEDKERQLRQVIDSIPTPMCYVDANDALPLRERRLPRLHRAALRRDRRAQGERGARRRALGAPQAAPRAREAARRSPSSGW